MRGRLPDALPLGALERFRDFLVMPTASIRRPKPGGYRLVAESDGFHVIASDGTDVGPLSSGGGAAIYDYTEDNTQQTLSSGATILSHTVTLAAGVYLGIALARPFSFTSGGSPGSVNMRHAGVQFGPQQDLRTTANIDHTFSGIVAHAGGSAAWDIWFAPESGSTQFGASGDVRFGRRLTLVRIGG